LKRLQGRGVQRANTPELFCQGFEDAVSEVSANEGVDFVDLSLLSSLFVLIILLSFLRGDFMLPEGKPLKSRSASAGIFQFQY
jgi:hypothetical protein